ncbi:transcriptional regulator, AraC family [Desulfatibacillum aliphaticivorans]|uniref:Transcriptional regulator, AraC family n=1 Tax=Desulfatibacillum aliphaticivorans TaxID=218208 RepID=B8FKC4_DESAL|nr:helix-turn-helix domain-containing protein [Desulfatibacillum aliphaticivorans]ACL01739.1 transcriptional regulator, AraC family [Desulfatibacillum aliphaticivorans]
MVWSIQAITLPIFFASGLALLLALEQVLRKKPNTANLLFSSIFVCCAIILWGAGAVANSLPPKMPLTIYLFFTAICCVGPLYYFYFTLLLHPEKRFSPRSLIHFIPAFGAFCAETGFQMLPLEFKTAWLNEMFVQPPRNALMVLVVIGAVHAAAYISYLLKMDLGLVWNVKQVKNELRGMLVIDVLAILCVVALYIGFTFKILWLFHYGGLLLTVLTVSVFLGYNRYPGFLQLLQEEFEKKRYEKSSLTHVDVSAINESLHKLIAEEKIYTDCELNLAGLADMLSLSPHQLSEFLNERVQTDFRSFINSFRVEEAKKLLVQEPDKNVLTICYDVGFGSKSTFNNVFKKETGQTPTQYRESALSPQTA